MFVYHSRGIYELPANLSVDRGELHAFLIDSRDRHREPKIHMNLVTHLADQQEKFGADHVWYYRGRSIIRRHVPYDYCARFRRRLRWPESCGPWQAWPSMPSRGSAVD